MRRLLRLVFLLAGLVLLALVGLLLFVDRLARTAIEEGGSYALGVETTLDDADIGLVGGRFALAGLAVANPQGFDAPRFLRLGRGEMELSLGSLLSDRIEVPSLELDDLEIALERKDGRANYDVILKNLERLGGEEPGEAAPPEPAGSSKKLVIRRIVLRNVRAEVQLLPVGGKLTRTTVTIPKLELSNVGNDGLSTSELFAAILDAVLRAVVDVGGDVLPKELLKDLQQKLPDLGAAAQRFASDVGKSLEGLGKEVGEEAGKALEGAKKGLEKLFEKD